MLSWPWRIIPLSDSRRHFHYVAVFVKQLFAGAGFVASAGLFWPWDRTDKNGTANDEAGASFSRRHISNLEDECDETICCGIDRDKHTDDCGRSWIRKRPQYGRNRRGVHRRGWDLRSVEQRRGLTRQDYRSAGEDRVA